MKEIKFRGQRIDNGEWVYGDFTEYSKTTGYITVDVVKNEVYRVDRKTVGQFIGLKDKNGKEIYDSSIVRYLDFQTSSMSGDGDEFMNIGVVEWDDDRAMFCVSNRHEVDMEDFDWSECEIIGNKYENPELLKERF